MGLCHDVLWLCYIYVYHSSIENIDMPRRKMPTEAELQGARYFEKIKIHISKFKKKRKNFHDNLKDFRTNVLKNYLNLLWFVSCTKKTKFRPNNKKYRPILEIRYCLFSVRHVWKYLVLNFCTHTIHMCESVYKNFQIFSSCGNSYFENELRGARPPKALTPCPEPYILAISYMDLLYSSVVKCSVSYSDSCFFFSSFFSILIYVLWRILQSKMP